MFTWIQTRSGRKMDFLAPDPDQVDIEDIAWALAGIPRFVAQTRQFYSVAQHSMEVARTVPLKFALEGLLHDAAEAYMGDCPGPLKQFCGKQYHTIERKINDAIATRFQLDRKVMPEIKPVDMHALAVEAHFLFQGQTIERWNHTFAQVDIAMDPVLNLQSRELVCENFLWCFNHYRDTRGREPGATDARA